MYIIRDPQDPSFSPVRDILDKKTSVQLYKLIVSACMYLSVLSGPIGGLLFAIRYGSAFGPVLPLRLHMKWVSGLRRIRSLLTSLVADHRPPPTLST